MVHETRRHADGEAWRALSQAVRTRFKTEMPKAGAISRAAAATVKTDFIFPMISPYRDANRAPVQTEWKGRANAARFSKRSPEVLEGTDVVAGLRSSGQAAREPASGGLFNRSAPRPEAAP